MRNVKRHPVVSCPPLVVRGLAVAFALLVGAWPMAARAFTVGFPPCFDSAAYFELMEPYDNPSSRRPKAFSEEEASRRYLRATAPPRDPLPLGVMLGDLGLLRNPCREATLSLTTQGLSLREEGRTRSFLASTARLSVHGDWERARGDLFASLTWLAWRSDGGGPGLGPASVGLGHGFFFGGSWSEERKLHTSVRVHLPSTFVASSSVRLGVEPGVALRFAPFSVPIVIHGGAALPWLNVETLDGTRAGLHLAPTASVTWRTAGHHVFTGEAGARVALHQVEQVTVGGAWRTALSRQLTLDLNAVAAVAGHRRGSFTLGARLAAL